MDAGVHKVNPAFKMEEKKTLTRKKSVFNFNHIDQKKQGKKGRT